MYEPIIPPIHQPDPIPAQPKEQDLDDFIFARTRAGERTLITRTLNTSQACSTGLVRRFLH